MESAPRHRSQRTPHQGLHMGSLCDSGDNSGANSRCDHAPESQHATHRGPRFGSRFEQLIELVSSGRSRSRAGLALAAICSLAWPAQAQDKVPIAWQGKTFTSSALPDKLGESQRKAIQRWEPWAKKAHYRLDFDAPARVLLLTPEKNSRAEAHLKIIARAETWFDAFLPPPDRTPIKGPEKTVVAKPAAAPVPPPDVIPEDPESPPPAAATQPAKTPPASAPAAKPATSWGSGSIEPDKETAVMLVLENEKDYASVVEMLSSTQSYLKDWSVEAKKSLGFVLEEPLSGAYVENASGQEEWSPDHELLNRIAQLLCLRRFGQQPNWIVQGLAWEAEMAFDGALYCFPYRSEFVGVGEHTAWPSDLRNLFKARADKPLKIEELSKWERGHWDAGASKIAWGFVHFAATQNPGKLSPLLEELRQFRDLDDRKTKSDTTWERIPGYEISGENQLTILKKHLGPDVMKNAGSFFRKEEPKKDDKKTAAK